LELLSGFLKDYVANDPRPQAAADIAGRHPEDAKYVLMGHTHEAKQSALAVSGPLLGIQMPQVYLNTGTWRPRQYQCLEGSDFIQWKDLTYVVVYKKEERDRVNPIPVFDTWTGKLYQ
jgi:UDP-2,3-diacylglucosamine pyrophosphatase LpxH